MSLKKNENGKLNKYKTESGKLQLNGCHCERQRRATIQAEAKNSCILTGAKRPAEPALRALALVRDDAEQALLTFHCNNKEYLV